LLATGSTLFSGVFFPTQLINEYAGSALGQIPRLLPFTYGLDGLRRVLIEGQTFQEVRGPLFVLLTYLVVLFPFSVWVFTRALRRAKREGSLIQY
jgi:ABC-2 type transport system permease protein